MDGGKEFRRAQRYLGRYLDELSRQLKRRKLTQPQVDVLQPVAINLYTRIGLLLSGGNPAIDLEKATAGQDADTAPGPELTVGDAVNWSFVVVNTGDVDLFNMVVSDEPVQPLAGSPVIVCEIARLPVGQSQTCDLSDTVLEGQYQNLGRVTAQGLGDSVVSDEDVSHYLGMLDIDMLSSLPQAVPTSGDAPLSVTFTPNATTNNAIIRYEWDFDGDGTFDRSETVGRDQDYTVTTVLTVKYGCRKTFKYRNLSDVVWI